MKFACVDGPDFDGHQVDFDEVIARNATYQEFEAGGRGPPSLPPGRRCPQWLICR